MKAKNINFMNKCIITYELCMSLFYCSFKHVSPLTECPHLCNSNEIRLFLKFLPKFQSYKNHRFFFFAPILSLGRYIYPSTKMKHIAFKYCTSDVWASIRTLAVSPANVQGWLDSVLRGLQP